MNDRQIEQIQERIRRLCVDNRSYQPAAVTIEVDALRWVLTDVCGVTPWITERPANVLSQAEAEALPDVKVERRRGRPKKATTMAVSA